MGKVYYISKNVGLGLLILAAIALATIIALSIAYDKERAKNRGSPGDGGADSTSMPSAPTTPSTPKEPWDHYRLPDSLVPISYNVTLWPRLKPNMNGLYIFTGQSSVEFRCEKETDLVIIHCNKLNLTSFSGNLATLIALGEAPEPSILKSWLVVKTEFLVMQLRSSLTVGATYLLYTEFVGELADDLGGFYRSEYIEDGVKKVVATSQMQATYARKTFPCFDEPAMKAVFNVIIFHDRDTVALSNGREIASKDLIRDGVPVRMTTFEPTKRMSTYLLAFIVRIWARRKAIDDGQGEYALNVTGPMLQFYEQYYNATYPLSKSDQIALPDFNAGAMENWGLITYRETALLYDPTLSSTGNKERVNSVIAHELAHMWFGNLVTLQWWNDLWLNEGFASYVEFLGVDYTEPTWGMKDQIVLYDIHKVFAVDALASSHPLSRREDEVHSPAQISEMFNTISYSKGAAVLRMLSEFLTEPVFAKGLSSYLNTFAFSNTVYTDLWDHLQQAVRNTPGMHIPHTVHDIMNRWTLQMGFPVVTVDTKTGSISQKHFLLDPEAVVERPSQFNYTWYVPIKWMKTGVEQQQYWLLQKTDTHREMRVSGGDWVLLNTNVSGYFRVNYDLDNWDRLLSALNTNHKTFSVLNRAQIIDDAFNLARANMINTTLALRTTKYLSKEQDYIPWESALRNLDYYILMFDRTQVYGVLQAYLRKQIQPLFEYFKVKTANWTKVPEGHTDQILVHWSKEYTPIEDPNPIKALSSWTYIQMLLPFRWATEPTSCMNPRYQPPVQSVPIEYNQINAVGMGCSANVPGCRELMKSWFRRWMENPQHNPIHPNLKSTVYCGAIAFGGVEEWDFAWMMYKNATMASEASKLQAAMACTKAPWLLNRYLDYTLDPTKIRKQDATSVILYVARNVVGLPLAWNFLRAKWSYIFKEYGEGMFSFSGLILGITRRFSTDFELQELKKFKEDNLQVGFGSGTMALEQAIETTIANIKWMKENKAHVMKWFTEEST